MFRKDDSPHWSFQMGSRVYIGFWYTAVGLSSQYFPSKTIILLVIQDIHSSNLLDNLCTTHQNNSYSLINEVRKLHLLFHLYSKQM